ncbi:MAG: 2,3-diphosphoglycerate-dependent phosphoglycerate mutase, partial [Acidimicrobiales bacterium]
MPRLVLLRHGESEWNQQNLFTGWWDAALTPLGESQATAAGRLMADHGVAADVVHTSLQTRAIRTVELALFEQGRSWIPVRRDWRLNERHYGDLTGRNKAETAAKYGAEQVKVWRRSYDVPPPPIGPENAFNPNGDERYAQVPEGSLPLSECLADVVRRMLPYWHEAIAADLRAGLTVLVGAHGNSLRALVKHLDGISETAIVDLNIPTGEPLVYELGDDLTPVDDRPVDERYLRSPE